MSGEIINIIMQLQSLWVSKQLSFKYLLDKNNTEEICVNEVNETQLKYTETRVIA